MTTRVDILKRDFDNIKFPQVCPVCASKQPDDHVRLSSYFGINQPLKESFGKKWSVTIPVCSEHKKTVHTARLISGASFLLMITLAMIVFYLIWQSISPVHSLALSIIAVACLSAAIYLHTKVSAAPLLFSAFSQRLLFTFKNDQLAEQFAKLNNITTVYNDMNKARAIMPSDENSSQ